MCNLCPLQLCVGGLSLRLAIGGRNVAFRDIFHIGGISISALAQLMFKSGASQKTLDMELKSASRELFAGMRKVLKLPLRDGGEFSWEVLDFPKALNFFASESDGLRDVYTSALRKFPPSVAHPWSLCIAFDEFAPGNKLQASSETSSSIVASNEAGWPSRS